MSRKHFSVLLVSALLVAVAVSLLVPQHTGRESQRETELIFPDLEKRINDADRVSVTTAGGRVAATLERGESDWTVAELGGYPASWATVRDLLAGLAQAHVVEVKTDNPEYYGRLGVEDVAGEDATGVLVTVGMGDEETAVIVGRKGDRRNGRYLRPAGTAQSVLSDFDAQVPDKTSGWVERDVADIASAEVAAVEIVHPDGDRIAVSKAAPEDTDFSLADLPQGRELKSSWAVNSLGGILAALQLDSVGPEDAVDWGDPIHIDLRTFEGMQVAVDAVLRGEDHWVRLSASAATPAEDEAVGHETSSDATPAVDAAAPKGAGEEADAGAQADTAEDGEGEDLQGEIDAFNARVQGWAFQIPAYKFEAMTKRMEDLLKSPDGDSD